MKMAIVALYVGAKKPAAEWRGLENQGAELKKNF